VPEWAFIALGSNLGDRGANLAEARSRLARLPHTRLVGVSVVEETSPIGPVSQPPFLNQMVLLHTELEPGELLDHCLSIECAAGRVRRARWGPRTLDLDIVRYGSRVLAQSHLTIPHPELPNRPFWQRELAELEGLAALSGDNTGRSL
jgi:2-amino-4-hydroxy-6-hydroxymethyldihydropteridine diphosphokinase